MHRRIYAALEGDELKEDVLRTYMHMYVEISTLP